MRYMMMFSLFMLLFQNENKVLAAGQISNRVEMLPWKEADLLLPKYSKFTVMDFETGKQFHVQRRAGSNHADVQPLTAKDTEIMKMIYDGKWSWRRRAVIIIHKGQWVAASMHGMPHGAGALKNNFPGHFCIHFFGCRTHRTRSMDLGHMLMVFKAAGYLDAYLGKANPYEVIDAYFTGLQQRDAAIASNVSFQKLKWRPIFGQIEGVKIARLSHLPPEDLTGDLFLDIPIEIDWFIKHIGRQTYRGSIHLVRFSQYDPWKIDSFHILTENHIIYNAKKPLLISK